MIELSEMLVIDFETKSRCDLKLYGADEYAMHDSTDILCLVMRPANPNDSREWRWLPMRKGIDLRDLNAAVSQFKYLVAHNARFDSMIWEYVGERLYGFPIIEDERWYCSSAQCRVNGLPAGLEDATRALSTNMRKDFRGLQLIKLLSIPQDDGTFNQDPQLHAEMLKYCQSDVRATKEVVNSCRLLAESEHRDWLNNERINDRGIRVDVELALLASQYAGVEKDAIGKELDGYTYGEVTKCTQSARMAQWVHPRLCSEGRELMTVIKKGVPKISLDSSIRDELLSQADQNLIIMPDDVYNAIAAYSEGSKSSISKFKTMFRMASADDDRVGGAFIYAGASTGRFTSRGLQLHNMKRDCWKPNETDSIKRNMAANIAASPDIMNTLAKLLRPALIPAEGHVFVVGDWKSIENRMVPFLANSPGGDKKLEAFKRYDADPVKNLDAYEIAALDAGIDDRQIGKVIELSLGYLGSVGAFSAMAKNYGVNMPPEEILKIIDRWRKVNKWNVVFGNALEQAALKAMRNPHTMFTAGRVGYLYNPDMMEGTLHCVGPSGSVISYPQARVETNKNGFPQITAMKANFKPKADAKQWPRFGLWRGLLLENVTQGECAALLKNSIDKLRDENVVLHCHDELALDVPESKAVEYQSLLQTVMEDVPAWAKGLILSAPAVIMRRYGK